MEQTKNGQSIGNFRTNKKESVATGLEFGKLPPQAIEFEEIALAVMILEPNAIADTMLFEECFYKENHQLIFRAIKNIDNRGERVDVMMVTKELKNSGDLEKVGGVMAVMELTRRVSSGAHFQQYENVIMQHYAKREFIVIATKVMAMAYDDAVDIEEVLSFYNSASASIDDIFTGKKQGKEAKEIIFNLTKEIEQRVIDFKKGGRSGITTGFADLDMMTNGWQKDWLIILAGRPAMGKSAIAVNQFAKKAAQDNKWVNIFSMEMSDRSLFERIILGASGIDSNNMRFGNFTDEDWHKYNQAASDIGKLPIWVDDKAYASFAHIRRMARKNKKKGKCDMVIIDYIQITETEAGSNKTREQEVSELSRKLKGLAKELQVPVIALSQLSRKVEERADKKPMLSDLRESGAIEQDADVVMFAYRPSYYGITEDEQGVRLDKQGFLLIRKNRNGDTGDVRFHHNDSMTMFYDNAPIEIPDFPDMGSMLPNYDFDAPSQNAFITPPESPF